MILRDISHQEFTIKDHYYFSKLSRLADQKGLKISVGSLSEGYRTIVLNYPERPFEKEEIEFLRRFVEQGGRLIGLGYYMGEDDVHKVLNEVFEQFGLLIEADEIRDPVHNEYGDDLFPVTSRVFIPGISKVLMPCSAPISISKEAEILIIGEDTAKTSSGIPPIFAARRKYGKGEAILIGTCVFRDNRSIEKHDNAKLALALLEGF